MVGATIASCAAGCGAACVHGTRWMHTVAYCSTVVYCCTLLWLLLPPADSGCRRYAVGAAICSRPAVESCIPSQYHDVTVPGFMQSGSPDARAVHTF